MPTHAASTKHSIQIARLPVGELEGNCYLLWREGGSEAVVFDPGDEAPRILGELKKRALTPAAFLLTHCHCDHIGALDELKKAWPAVPIIAPEAEKDWLPSPTRNLSYFIGGARKLPPADRAVKDDEVLRLADLELRALNVRGHSPGSTAYFVKDAAGGPAHLVCGDILFHGGIGRGDLPGGEGEEVLVANIRARLFTLPSETVVHPGHGDETSIGHEKAFNPFCGVGVDIA